MSQLNRNAAYIYEVDGLTVWEKLRVLRGFLVERNRSLRLSEYRYNKQVKSLKEGTCEEPEKVAIEIEEMPELHQDCKDEIAFLEKSIAALEVAAEKTRIAGKTDREMYEINFFSEHTTRLVFNAMAEVASCGRVSTETMKYLMRNRSAMYVLIDKNILDKKVLDFVEETETIKVIEKANHELIDYK